MKLISLQAEHIDLELYIGEPRLKPLTRKQGFSLTAQLRVIKPY